MTPDPNLFHADPKRTNTTTAAATAHKSYYLLLQITDIHFSDVYQCLIKPSISTTLPFVARGCFLFLSTILSFFLFFLSRLHFSTLSNCLVLFSLSFNVFYTFIIPT